jgi:hypothetical protein
MRLGREIMKKIFIGGIIMALAGGLWAQSVVELSKREKARRMSLGNNRARVVTNVDLAAVRKTPAVIVTVPDASTDSSVYSAENPDAAGTAETGQAGGNPPAVVRMVPTVSQNGPQLFGKGGSDDQASTASSRDIESRLRAADELIDLLTTKINALMQEANNLDTMTPKDVIQKQLDDTNQKLLKVQDEAAKLRAQLEAAKKSPAEKR